MGKIQKEIMNDKERNIAKKELNMYLKRKKYKRMEPDTRRHFFLNKLCCELNAFYSGVKSLNGRWNHS
jgi:hypothetical protein